VEVNKEAATRAARARLMLDMSTTTSWQMDGDIIDEDTVKDYSKGRRFLILP
jgi:hypothetical protein